MTSSLLYRVTQILAEETPESGTFGSLWNPLPPQGSTAAGETDPLFYFITGLSALFFLAIVGAIIYFVIKYRRQREDQKTSPVKHHTGIEIAWSVIPGILLLVIFVWGFKGFLSISVPPPDALEIRVTARQWSWEFDYPSLGLEGETVLTVPVNRPVRVIMRSDDVIHSFYVPAFRVKRDVLPNRYTSVWFEATELGTYDLLCTEYCGTLHSSMWAEVRVVDQATWEEFVEMGSQELTPVQRGERLFASKGCSACHNADDPARPRVVGPGLYGVMGHEVRLESGETLTVDTEYLRNSILNPAMQIVEGYPNAMNVPPMTDTEIDYLVLYISQLGVEQPPDEGEGAEQEGGGEETEGAEEGDEPEGTGETEGAEETEGEGTGVR
jgi:cytochrome c oxidase subunit 2